MENNSPTRKRPRRQPGKQDGAAIVTLRLVLATLTTVAIMVVPIAIKLLVA